MTTPPVEQRKNAYDDADFLTILNEIDALNKDIEDEKSAASTIAAASRGRVSGFARKIKDAKKTAVKLNIPGPVLDRILEQRRLERELIANVAMVPDQFAEVYEDASGQFSMFKPVEGEKPKKGANVVSMAAAAKTKAAKENAAVEQQQGAELVDSLSKPH